MKRWLPAPLMSAGLLALWLMLNDTLSIPHVLLGALLAIVIPILALPLRPVARPVRHPLAIVRLICTVAGDVFLSALDVGSGVLRAARRTPNSRFVVVPLDLRDSQGLAALAMITAVIPGTVWSELSPDRSAVLVHVFNLTDETAFVHHFKSRYERPLKEIFE